MRMMHAARGFIIVAAAAIAVLASVRATPAGELLSPQGEEVGFVVSRIGYAFAPNATQAEACPEGIAAGYATVGDVFVSNPNTPADSEPATLENATERALSDLTTPTLCQNPDQGAPDPNWRVVSGDIAAPGIDLDGQSSRARGRPAPGTCAHDDFLGADSARNIDNQFFRAIGCVRASSYEGGFDAEMLTGAWGILIVLSDVDDLNNDSDIGVGLYANADPIELGPNREPLPHATYAMDQDPRFRAVTRGRIVNGVLTSDAVDVRFRWVLNGMRLERPLRDARLHVRLTTDGRAEGYLAGYTPVEAMYDLQFGFRNATDDAGHVAPLALRTLSSVGFALVSGRSCEGAYFAMLQYADGHPDSQTGRCTSISTQYRIEAVPAFVVDVGRGVTCAARTPGPASHWRRQAGAD